MWSGTNTAKNKGVESETEKSKRDYRGLCWSNGADQQVFQGKLMTIESAKQELKSYKASLRFIRSLTSQINVLSDLGGNVDDLKATRADHEQTAKGILRKLDSMPYGEEKTILAMRYIDGSSWKSIAIDLGYSESRIFSIHATALRRYSALI